MNYKKLLLVGVISAFVALLTSVMGVAGTIIGSVISSVLYNMLTEALEKPVGQATFSTNFEWDIAYIFPIAVIALIQLVLIFALLAESGLFPNTFLNVYMSIQQLANNNLYRLLGIALLVISAYPLILKPEFVKKEHGAILVFVAMIFLARGFVDLGNSVTALYDDVFVMYDLPIAIIAFILLLFVIIRILVSAKKSEDEFRTVKHNSNTTDFEKETSKVSYSKGHEKFEGFDKKSSRAKKNKKAPSDNSKKSKVNFKNHIEKQDVGNGDADVHSHIINRSSEKIKFESNDLLDDYKK